MGHFIKHEFQFAVAQEEKRGFFDKLDLGKAKIGITLSPYFKGDPDAPPDEAWWMPTIKKVVDYFIGEEYLAPELPSTNPLIYYFLAPLPQPKVLFIIHFLIFFLGRFFELIISE